MLTLDAEKGKGEGGKAEREIWRRREKDRKTDTEPTEETEPNHDCRGPVVYTASDRKGNVGGARGIEGGTFGKRGVLRKGE